MAIGGVVIQFVADTARAVRDIGRLDNELDQVGDESTRSKGKFGKLSAAWAASIPIAGAVVAALAAEVNFLVDAGKAALEDRKQHDKLAQTLGKIPGITQEMIDANSAWIDSMELATLVSDTDLREAMSKLALATGDVTKAQQLVTLAVDTSAASGKDLTTVTDALAKAANGNTAALKRQFPWLDKNKDGTLTFTEATDGLHAAFDGAATAAANNDPFKRLKVIWDQLKESIGQALIPLIDRFSQFMANATNRANIEKFIQKVAELSQALGTDLVNAINQAIAWLKKPENQQKLRDWADLLWQIAKAAAQVVAAVKKLITWLEKIPKPPAWLSGGSWIMDRLNGSRTASMGASTKAAPVVLNVTVEGVQDPYAAARIIEQQLSRYAKLQGRADRPRAVAW